jgi:hypothetical protein
MTMQQRREVDFYSRTAAVLTTTDLLPNEV